MTTTPLIITYIGSVLVVAIVWWLIAKRNLKRERVNNLQRGDKIKVLGEFDATYCKRIDHNTHRVNVCGTIHEVDTNLIKIK